MIVLSIAGLMLILVFEAIPALMLNSRNTQRKQDVATILQDISHYELNHSAVFPMLPSDVAAAKELSYYTFSQIRFYAQAAPAGFSNTNINGVYVYNFSKCDPNNPGRASRVGADSFDIVALYGIETAGGSSGACEQL